MHAVRHAGLAGLMAVALVGCAWSSRIIAFSFPADGNIAALPVVLTDKTGIVVSIDEPPPNIEPLIPEGMMRIAAIPNAVIVHWVGGACDENVVITASGSPGTTFAVVTTRKPGGCDAIGILRAILIRLTPGTNTSQLSVTFD